MSQEIYTEFDLLNGDHVTVILPRGKHISKVMLLNSKQPLDTEIDVSMLFMQELCFINGDRKKLSYFQELMIDDYSKLLGISKELLTPITNTLT